MNDDKQNEEPKNEQLLRSLRAFLAEVDPVPLEVVEAARRAFDWLNVDAELAELVFDSDRAEEALAGIRSLTPARLLTFESPGLVVELEVDLESPLPLVGQLVPAGPAEVEIRHGRLDRTMVVEANEFGSFCSARLGPGPVSLRVTPLGRGERSVTTSWVTVAAAATPPV